MLSLFQRNYDGDKLVRDEIVPDAEWVIAGEGIATVKVDGSCAMIRDGILHKRYDAKHGKIPPIGFIPAQGAPDPVTGHWPGWLKVGDGPEDQWFRAAVKNHSQGELLDWTYELLGPAVQGNPYRLTNYLLDPHGARHLVDAPRAFDALKLYLSAPNEERLGMSRFIEGIVWWRDLSVVDCDKVKIKRRDFGLEWPVKGVASGTNT